MTNILSIDSSWPLLTILTNQRSLLYYNMHKSKSCAIAMTFHKAVARTKFLEYSRISFGTRPLPAKSGTRPLMWSTRPVEYPRDMVHNLATHLTYPIAQDLPGLWTLCLCNWKLKKTQQCQIKSPNRCNKLRSGRSKNQTRSRLLLDLKSWSCVASKSGL